jgi:hypothetical protein
VNVVNVKAGARFLAFSVMVPEKMMIKIVNIATVKENKLARYVVAVVKLMKINLLQ